MAEEFDDADFLAAASAVDGGSSRSNGQAQSNGNASKVVQPKPQALPQRQGPSAILVSTRQKGNPILNHVKGQPWEYSDIPCDYVIGATTCALFLSLKYHRLHPEYIYTRLRQLGKLYNLRVLLTMVDIENHEEALKELSKTSMINNLTLVLCWTAQEAGRYLELFKSYEHASPASIRAHQAETYQESLTEFVTTPRSINKTDAASLISNFGSLRAAINAEPEELALVPGWGEKKIKDWCGTVREPFRVKSAGRTNIALMRQETTATEEGSSRGGSPGLPPAIQSAVPISTVAATRREGSVPTMSRENTRPQSSHKRARLEEITPTEIDDQDAAIITAVDQTTRSSDAEKPKIVQAITRDEPELSDGVMAALAKLRKEP